MRWSHLFRSVQGHGNPFRLRRDSRGGHLGFRGTLGVERDAAVGYGRIKLIFEIATEADEEQLAKLVELTDRYCVVFQSLKSMEPSQFVKTDA